MEKEGNKYIKAIKKNDFQALKELYQQFLPKISYFIKNNGGTFEDAKDVFQDALVVIYKKTRSNDFELTSGFYTLLYGICRNLWGNRLQKKSRTEVTLTDDYKYTFEDETSRLIEKEEENRIFWDAFRQLGQGCQRLLELFFAKTKMADIVQQLELSSVAYAKKRKFQCKEQLIKLVKADARYVELNYKVSEHGGKV